LSALHENKAKRNKNKCH